MEKKWDYRNWIYAFGLGVVISLIVWLLPYPWMHPLVWDDVSVGMGMRPAISFMPGFGRLLMAAIGHFVSITEMANSLHLIGCASAVLIGVLTYFLFISMIPSMLNRRFEIIGITFEDRRKLAVVASIVAVSNSAVWRMMQCFSSIGLHFVLMLLASILVVRFVTKGGIWYIYSAMIFWGILATETPFGLIGGIFSCGIVWWESFNGMENSYDSNMSSMKLLSVYRGMSYIFFFFIVLAFMLNVWSFRHYGGQLENGIEFIDIVYLYGEEYLDKVRGMMNGAGIVGSIIFVILPLFVVYLSGVKSAKVVKVFNLKTRIIVIICAVIAWSQTSGFSNLHFYSWIHDPIMVRDEFTFAVLGYIGALVLLLSSLILAVDFAQRNVLRGFKFMTIVFPVLVIASVLPMRLQIKERQMLKVISDYCFQTARECRDVKRVFTDGRLDVGIELAAKFEGNLLYALSVLSGNSLRDVAIRQRGVTNPFELSLLSDSAFETLRVWLNDKPTRHSEFAIQTLENLWLDCKRYPALKVGGLVSRPAGMNSEVEAEDVLAAHKLADKILQIDVDTVSRTVDDITLRDGFTFVRWCLARIRRARCRLYSGECEEKELKVESQYATALDLDTLIVQRWRQQLERLEKKDHAQVTSGEGLKASVGRADFKSAEIFARNVLSFDPDDSLANFAIGMKHFFDGDYKRAEDYLKRVLVRKPNEPSVLNNLSVIAMRLGRFEEAITNAELAIKAAPEASEIKLTLLRAKRLRDEALEKKRVEAEAKNNKK